MEMSQAHIDIAVVAKQVRYIIRGKTEIWKLPQRKE